jgi:hypothetical protein
LNSYVNIDGTPNQSLGGYEAHGNSCLYWWLNVFTWCRF